ncbi:MAG: DUF547 domain-containing protein [Elusimicrobia bacterium]|nr:DUF547 domain-containing protein [Elusimicrobiota bacterium]
MIIKQTLFLSLLFLSLGVLNSRAYAKEFDHSHSAFAQVLQKYVKDGAVNYRSLKSDPRELNSYLDQLVLVQESEFNAWSKNQQLSFLINLYNSSTLKLIIDHYPLKSIKDIGNVFKGPWDQPIVRLFGQTVTLNHLEHHIIRKKYEEPRVHFALVCAAKGCPPLREEPYIAKKLEEQFLDQGKKFFATEQKNSIDNDQYIIYLSPIFDWFKEDFIKKSGSILAFIQPYFSKDKVRELLKGNFQIKYTYYDWSLNNAK